MWIYKITNIQNNKIYIGQSSRNVKERISRHFNDAESGRLDTHYHIKVKQINVETGEEMIFSSQMEGARYHHVKNKDFIAKRCSGQITTPYHGIYMFEYYNE